MGTTTDDDEAVDEGRGRENNRENRPNRGVESGSKQEGRYRTR